MKFLAIVLACLTCINLEAELFFTPQMINQHLETYSEKEIELIEKDLNVVRSVCFHDVKKTESKFYLATAGGPGARKSTILEKFVSSHIDYQEGIYLDPDPRTLKFMVHTYQARSLNHLTISQVKNYDQVIKEAYNKWRDGSNYIVLNLFEEAVEAGYSVIHGTTSTKPYIADFFSQLKQKGYHIVILLCSCPDDLRKKAVEYRNQEVRFYQSSPEEVLTKGKSFSLRMKDYFDCADVLYFYWSDDLFSSERLAGTWQNGKLEIHDHEAMQYFSEKYETDRASLAAEGKAIPSFESYFIKQ